MMTLYVCLTGWLDVSQVVLNLRFSAVVLMVMLVIEIVVVVLLMMKKVY